MRLARQWCELNDWSWPDDLSGEPLGYENASSDQKHSAVRFSMKMIESEIYKLTYIDPELITNYYLNCYYLDDANTPQEWIEWIFFGKLPNSGKCMKENEYCGYTMGWKG